MTFIDFNFKHPTIIQVVGLTGCGKTRLVRKIFEEQLILPFATRISEWQQDYELIRERYPGIEFVKEWRDEIFDSLSLEQRNILVLDDQMALASSSTFVTELFTKGWHHRNLTVIYLVSNVYYHEQSQRTISFN